MVNIRASANGLVLGQTTVEEKSNEITAIPKLRLPHYCLLSDVIPRVRRGSA